VKTHYTPGDKIAWTNGITGLLDTGRVKLTAIRGDGQDIAVKQDGATSYRYIPQTWVEWDYYATATEGAAL